MANTEIQYVKNKIQKLEADFAGFASLLIESGIVEVEEQNGELRYKVNKVKLEAVKNEQPTDKSQSDS